MTYRHSKAFLALTCHNCSPTTATIEAMWPWTREYVSIPQFPTCMGSGGTLLMLHHSTVQLWFRVWYASAETVKSQESASPKMSRHLPTLFGILEMFLYRPCNIFLQKDSCPWVGGHQLWHIPAHPLPQTERFLGTISLNLLKTLQWVSQSISQCP